MTCYHIYHLTLFILDTVLANSADPDEMPHKAAFHLVLHCLLRKKIQTSWLSKLKKYKSRITLSAIPSSVLTYVLCMCASLYVCVHIRVRVYFNMKITECFLILTYVLCLYVNLHLTDRRTCACVFIDFLSHSEDPDETLVSTVCLDRNNLRGQKKKIINSNYEP